MLKSFNCLVHNPTVGLQTPASVILVKPRFYLMRLYFSRGELLTARDENS